MTDVLVFVEDPGAVNGIVGLDEALRRNGLGAVFLGAGHALDYAQGIGTALTPAGGESAIWLIERYKPSVLLVGTAENPETLGLALIDAAKSEGIPAAAFVDGPGMAELRFRGKGTSATAHMPDRLLVPDPATASAFASSGFDKARIAVVGHAHFDRVRAAARRFSAIPAAERRKAAFADAPAGRKVLLFLSELSDGLDAAAFTRNADYTLSGRGDSDLRTDIVFEEVLDALPAGPERPYVVLRLHPKDNGADFAAYGSEIDATLQGGDPLFSVFAADVVVGLTTMLLFEAAIMGRPALAVTPRECERAWLTGIGMGAVRHVWTREALRTAITAGLADPKSLVADNLDAVLPSGAADRMAAEIAALAKG